MLEDLNGNYPGVTLENIQAIERLRHKLIKSENDLDDAQEEVKRLKKKVNSVQQDINRVNGMLVDRQNYMNLKSDDVATSEDPPKPGEHREVSIAVLANHSAPHAVIEALNDEGVQTFDQLEEWLANNELTEIEGIDSVAEQQFAEARNAWHAEFYKDTDLDTVDGDEDVEDETAEEEVAEEDCETTDEETPAEELATT